MKYWIDDDSAYPVFYLLPADSAVHLERVVDVPDELVKRYERVCKEYGEVQYELAKLVKYYD